MYPAVHRNVRTTAFDLAPHSSRGLLGTIDHENVVGSSPERQKKEPSIECIQQAVAEICAQKLTVLQSCNIGPKILSPVSVKLMC